MVCLKFLKLLKRQLTQQRNLIVHTKHLSFLLIIGEDAYDIYEGLKFDNEEGERKIGSSNKEI